MGKDEIEYRKTLKVLRAYIDKNKRLCDIPDDKTLAIKIHIHPVTLCLKMNGDREFTRRELWRIFKVLQFTDEEKAACM